MQAAQRPTEPQKACSICDRSFRLSEFCYGNRDNRSYCQNCDRLEKQAYAQGGKEAARAFRDEMRRSWKK